MSHCMPHATPVQASAAHDVPMHHACKDWGHAAFPDIDGAKGAHDELLHASCGSQFGQEPCLVQPRTVLTFCTDAMPFGLELSQATD